MPAPAAIPHPPPRQTFPQRLDAGDQIPCHGRSLRLLIAGREDPNPRPPVLETVRRRFDYLPRCPANALTCVTSTDSSRVFSALLDLLRTFCGRRLQGKSLRISGAVQDVFRYLTSWSSSWSTVDDAAFDGVGAASETASRPRATTGVRVLSRYRLQPEPRPSIGEDDSSRYWIPRTARRAPTSADTSQRSRATTPLRSPMGSCTTRIPPVPGGLSF